MTAITKVDFIADQLKGMSPGVDWNLSGIDRAKELAQIFERNGVTDLWRMRLMKGTAIKHIPASTHYTESNEEYIPARDETIEGYYFDYEGKRIGYLGTPTEPVNDPLLQNVNGMQLIAWSAEGHGHVNYVVRPNAAKTALEIAPIWGSSSDASNVRLWATVIASFFVMTALPLAGFNVGNAIGSAVLPASVSAAYPGLATAIGNVAISTALNGGNVENAVKGVVGSQIAGGLGSGVSSITGSETVGSLASAAARAAISGGDVKSAVGMQLLQLGSNMDDITFDFFGGSDTSGSVFGDTFNYTQPYYGSLDQVDLINQNSNPWYFDQYIDFNGGSNEFGSFDISEWTAFPTNDFGVSTFTPETGASNAAPPAQTKVPASSSAWDATKIVQNISSAALATISLIKAYRALDTPAVNTTARKVNSDGSVSIITSNGTVQTKKPDGTINVTKPPVGVPQTTLNGEIVINNGDGTYTVVSQSGASATYRYDSGATSSEGNSSMLMVGAGLLALLLLKG